MGLCVPLLTLKHWTIKMCNSMSVGYEKPSTPHLPKGTALLTSACRYWPLFTQLFPLSFSHLSLAEVFKRASFTNPLFLLSQMYTRTSLWVCVGLQKRNHSCSSLHEESVCDLVQQALIKRSTLCVRMSVLKRIEHKPRHMEHLSLFTVPGHIVTKCFLESMTHFTIKKSFHLFFCVRKRLTFKSLLAENNIEKLHFVTFVSF